MKVKVVLFGFKIFSFAFIVLMSLISVLVYLLIPVPFPGLAGGRQVIWESRRILPPSAVIEGFLAGNYLHLPRANPAPSVGSVSEVASIGGHRHRSRAGLPSGQRRGLKIPSRRSSGGFESVPAPPLPVKSLNSIGVHLFIWWMPWFSLTSLVMSTSISSFC